MIDPYIVIEVLTPNQSFAEFKTKTIKVCSPYCDICFTSCDENLTFVIKNNGFDPHFETTFKIGQIGIPEVSFLKIRVFDEDGPLDKDDFGNFFISDDDKLAFYIQLPSHIFLYIL